MRKLLIITITLLANSIAIIAQDEGALIQLPEWFMRPNADSYIGISAPESNEQDAINMAIFQILMAHEFTAQCQEITESYFEESINESTGKTTNVCRLTIDTTISFSVQNLSKLESGEYVCRVTKGGNLQHPVKLVWERYYVESFINDGDFDAVERMTCKCEMGKWQFVMKTTSTFTDQSGSEFLNEDYSFSSLFENFVADDYAIKSIYANPALSQGRMFTYSFPSSSKTKYANSSSVFFSLTKERSLFEQMLIAYWQILYAGFVKTGDNYVEKSTGGILFHLHKATPLLGFNYKDGVFEIMYEKP